MVLLASLLSQGMFLAGVALLLVILMRRWHRYYGRRPRGKKQSSALLSTRTTVARPIRSLSDAPKEVLRWQVELEETARDLMGQLDSKIRVLQILNRSATQQADRLQRLLDAAGADLPECSPRPNLQPDPSSVPAASSDQTRPQQQAAIYALADQGHHAEAIAQRVGAPLGEVELILSLRSPQSS